MTGATDFQSVLNFWFEELSSEQWYRNDPTLDSRIESRFGATHKAGITGELSRWRSSIDGRLAEIIVLDQFSRNLFRGRPEAFAADGMALVLAQEAIEHGKADELEPRRREFLYMPFMHSESPSIHNTAIELFSREDMDTNLDYEIRHKLIIDRFGRYPHRNAILGRKSTADEISFLKEKGSSF